MWGRKFLFSFFREEREKAEASQSVRGGVRDAEVGSGDYRLSGVFHLWSKCTLAFFLSTPHMQLDFSLAKQTQMKWLLNDFLGNPPRQRKPSIWSLLSPPLLSFPPLFLSSLFPFPSLHPSSPDFSLWFLVIFPHVFFFDLLARLALLISTVRVFFFLCKSLFPALLFTCRGLCFFCYVISSFYVPLYVASTLVTQIRIHLSNF